MYVFAYGIHILHILFYGIGVVKTQVACAAKLFGDTEVHAYGLGMAYVEITVGFRRETRVEASAVLACLQVVVHCFLYEVHAAGLIFGRGYGSSVCIHILKICGM